MIASLPGSTAARYSARRSSEPAIAERSIVETSPMPMVVTSSMTSIGNDRNTGPVGAVGVMERAANQNRNLVGVCHLSRPFHGRCRDGDKIPIKQGIGERVSGVLLAGGDHQGSSRNAGVQKIAEAMAKAASSVEVKETRSAGGLRIAVSHCDRAGLLQRPDVADIGSIKERVHQRQFRSSRVAKDIVHTLTPQHFKEDVRPAARAPFRFV
jgi:hypothetical protein